MKKLYILISLFAFSLVSQGQVVISQVYGGGGNAGAPFTHDFVELFNKGNVAVNIGGWSLQLASATGTGWIKSDLPSFNLLPGKYYLIQHAPGANTAGTSLPLPITADLITSAAAMNQLAIAGSNIKILLANNNTLVSAVTNPTDSQIVDLFGCGTATGFEGTVATAVSNSLSGQRKSGGCQDSNNNLADFESLAPAPRNNATPTNNCALAATNQFQIEGLKIFVSNSQLNVVSESNDLKAVVVYNILGKQVINTTTSGNPINVSELSSGIYIVKVTENGKSNTLKVVIQ